MKYDLLRKPLSVILVIALLLPQLTMAVSATETIAPISATSNTTAATTVTKGAEIKFQCPADVDPASIKIEVYGGLPIETDLTKVTPLKPTAGGKYIFNTVGTNFYRVSGEGYYTMIKMFNITQADLDAGEKSVKLTTGPVGGGYEPSYLPKDAPKGFKQDARDREPIIWPDELLKVFATDSLKSFDKTLYDTPAFATGKAANQFTTQSEMMKFITDLNDTYDNMHVYNIGNSPLYDYATPLVIFTTSSIPKDATLAEAAAIVKNNKKLNVWHQTQIHANEPASGESALVMMESMDGAYGANLLNSINVIIVPRINPEGSYLFSRTNALAVNDLVGTPEPVDMNRDHMSLKSQEISNLHTAYRYFMPEVTIDGHEFTFFGLSKDDKTIMGNADDLQVTGASSLNNDKAVNALTLNMVDKLHKTAVDDGVRIYHYGTTVNNPIGRAYYGLYNSISILLETRGIGAGKVSFQRRVHSQVLSAKSIYEQSAKNAREIKDTVATARAKVVSDGKTYNAEDVVILKQTASGKTMSPTALVRYQFNMLGEQVSAIAKALSMNDTVERSRIRPTAYIMAKDAPHIEDVIYIMKNQGVEYISIAKGSGIDLQQYCYVEGEGANYKADVLPMARVNFPEGAYLFPMDQVAGNVIAMTFEPDVNDSNGYDGTLVQYGIVTAEKETNKLPIYRYIGNNPRVSLSSLIG